jgi:hypothetical protein
MKTSEIRKEAKKVIADIFYKVVESEDKELWLKAFTMISNKIEALSNGDRGEQMFIWKSVKSQIATAYGKKFISK